MTWSQDLPWQRVVKTPAASTAGALGLKCEGSGSPQRHGKVWLTRWREQCSWARLGEERRVSFVWR